MESQGNAVSRAFLCQAGVLLQEDFIPKIRKCLGLLTDEEIWWRGSETENSIGNLLMHLEGNVRQWLISGLGGAPDTRNRPGEFSSSGRMAKAEALARLEQTVAEAVAVLDALPDPVLLQPRTVQGFRRTGLEAVFHVVEHFSYHTGQIVFVTKFLRHQDLKFYDL